MADQAARHFLPWVRHGLAAAITTPDTLSPSAAGHAAMQVSVTGSIAASANVQIHGPGDVTGLDPAAVIRTDPVAGSTDFVSNFFPSLEFDRPDLPWMFTPLQAGADGRLRPWLCLVVVRKQDGVRIVRRPTALLPVLEVDAPARPDDELPDLSESWAWAHAQVLGRSGDTDVALREALAHAPARTVSRLVCPRKLEPLTSYIACVVPTFEVGKRTGLGETIDTDDLSPSWTRGATSVSLPIYVTWEFATAERGDFESLVRQLEPRRLPDTVGTRPLDLSAPGFGLPSTPGATVRMGGALRAVDTPPESPVPPLLVTALADVLNTPAEMQEDATSDPIVAPPIYGGSYPQIERVAVAGGTPPWVHALNLDPRHRIAAALGARIVQRDQDALMASAWQQAEILRRENAERRRRTLALAARASTFERHVRRLDADALLQVLGPGMSKVAVVENGLTRTVASQVWASAFPVLCEPSLRRVARPRGPVNRRALPAPLRVTNPRRLVKLIDRLPQLPPFRPAIEIVPPRLPAMVTVQRVSAAAGTPFVDATQMTAARVSSAPERGFTVWVRDHWERATVAFSREFRQAAIEHLQRAARPAPAAHGVFSVPDAAALRQRLDPRLSRRATRDAPVADDVEVVAHPVFPYPMSEALIDTAPGFLLPGLQAVPSNTVTLVGVNAAFIESFMVGLNHEMGRELLWREYPTDQRGTYFDQFWDSRGAGVTALPRTLPPLHRWNAALGSNATAATGADLLVLLVRGELLRRFPTAIVYAARARRDTDGGVRPTSEERHPVFRGTVAPDITFLGFALTEAEARGDESDSGDPGWFFCFKQQPGEPSFGLDADPGGDPSPVVRWDDLTWRHVVSTSDELRALSHLRVAQGSPPRPDTSANPPGARWGQDAAHMARITLQRPVRLAILARLMLPAEQTPDA